MIYTKASIHIAILSQYDDYVFRCYYCKKLAEALNRMGIETSIIDNSTILQQIEEFKRACNPQETLFTCAFDPLIPPAGGNYFIADRTGVPHICFLIDPALRYQKVFNSKNTLIACVDHFECDYVRSHNFNKVFFWGHAVDRELAPLPNQVRPYDVVYIGACYDYENLRKHWQMNLKKMDIEIIESASEQVLRDNCTPIYKALTNAMLQCGIALEEIDKKLFRYAYYVDFYTRGKDRIELIHSIKNAQVHVFGGHWKLAETSNLGWDYYLQDMKNVTIHPPITLQNSLEILKQSKICLNSMPFFKNGTHDRIFNGLAAGSLPITSDNLWIRKHFEHEKNILIYPPHDWKNIDSWVQDYLQHPSKREQIVACGREIVMKDHTWDVRAQQLLDNFKHFSDRLG